MEIILKPIIISILFCVCFRPLASHAGPPTPGNPTTNAPATTIAPDALNNEQQKLPDLKPRPLPQKPEFRLPPVEIAPEKDPLLSAAFSVFINEIRLTGNTVFSDQALKQITGHYENRSVTNGELLELRYQLTRYYIDHGYINSGVILPDQQIKNGIVNLQVIEGKLTEIVVNGTNWLRPSYIKRRIAHGIDSPLNIHHVQERLLLLQQDPLIERVNAELHPGLKPGDSQMVIHVTEARPYEAGVNAANNRSPSIGSISGQFWLQHKNLTGFGDRFYFSYTGTEGLHDFYGSYSIPLTAYDTRLNVYYQQSEADVVDLPRNNFSIESRSQVYGVALSHPFYKTPSQTVLATLAFEHRRSKTFLDNRPSSFATGVPDEGNDKGISKISVLRFSQDWIHRNQTQVIAARSTLSWGLNVFDATHHSNEDPDGQFFSWLGQFQWIRRLPLFDSQLLFRSNIQLANEALLPLEKFSVGGRYSVRGYRENRYVRDNGASVSLEWQVPIFRLPVPGLSQTITDGQVQLATFVDFGWSNNRDLKPLDENSAGDSGPNTIASWGLGILWDPAPKFHAELYWGRPFRSLDENTKEDIQDIGIHFQVNAQFF
jgi:hemolysin activation/secretion protein